MSENNDPITDYPEITQRLLVAFPSSIRAKVFATLALMPASRLAPTDRDIGQISILGEVVHIPFRIYSPEPSEVFADGLDRVTLSILACLYTRHHDGYVRQKHVTKLFDFDDPWIPPFVLQLIGEYVIEIIEDISQKIHLLPANLYKEFINENPAFIQLLKQRIISYWDCYYRFRFPDFNDYVGF